MVFNYTITKLHNYPIPKMRARLHNLRSSEAAEIAEAAMVLPVVFIFLLGIIWFGRAFNIYSTITQAAQQGAIVGSALNVRHVWRHPNQRSKCGPGDFRGLAGIESE